MSAELDPLEAELASLRPLPVSPALRQRLAGRLDEARARGPYLALAGLAAALAAAVFLGRGAAPPSPAVPATRPAAAAVPLLRDYRRALARSPEAAEALLDEPTRPADGPPPALVRAFPRYAPDLLD